MGFQPTLLGSIPSVPQIADDYNFPTLIESLFCVLHKTCGLSVNIGPTIASSVPGVGVSRGGSWVVGVLGSPGVGR